VESPLSQSEPIPWNAPLLVLPAGARNVLDYGCGTGWVLASAKGDEPTVRTGVDLFRPGLLEGKGRFPTVTFVQGDGGRLPFRDSAFDAVVGHVSIPYIDTSVALREIYRVLRPGGRVWMTAHSLSYLGFRWSRTVRAGRLRDLPFPVYLFANAMLLHHGLSPTHCWWKPGLFETVHTHRGIERALEAAGLEEIRTAATSPRIFLAFEARKPSRDGWQVLDRIGCTFGAAAGGLELR
jgi:SAM-dependent methyltransferase